MNAFWDRLGISTSILCVIHCLLTPVLLILVPVAGSTLMRGWFHALIILVAVPVAFYALWRGYRIHRHTSTLTLGFLGLLSIGAAMMCGGHHGAPESVFMILAGLFLATAHYKNLKACRLCQVPAK